jgi:hypothetical protein
MPTITSYTTKCDLTLGTVSRRFPHGAMSFGVVVSLNVR